MENNSNLNVTSSPGTDNRVKEDKTMSNSTVNNGSTSNIFTQETLDSLKMKMMGNFLVVNHSDEEIKTIQNRNSAIALLSGEQTDKVNYDDNLGWEQLQKKATGNKIQNRTISDFMQVGSKEPVNVVLQKKMNIAAQSKVAGEVTRDAAHLSINIQKAAESGDFAIVDKDIDKDLGPLFTHRSASVKTENGISSITSYVNEGQMEATAILLNEHEEMDVCAELVNDLHNYLAYRSADRIANEVDPEVVKDKARNLAILLNKSAIRNQIDARVLAGMPDEEKKESTKADRAEVVNNYMDIVNSTLGTHSTDSYVATIELSNWIYSIFQMDSGKQKAFSHEIRKGRKYWDLGDDYILKVDMKGSKAGGKVPITSDMVEEVKKICGDIQNYYLIAAENQIRENLGVDRISNPKPSIPEIDKEVSGDKVVSYIFKKAKIEDTDVLTFLNDIKKDVEEAIDKAFKEATSQKIANSL